MSVRPRPNQPRTRSFRQLALATLVLLALVVGSLAHNHAGRDLSSGQAGNDGCAACLLHHTSAAEPAVVLPTRVPVPPEETVARPLVSAPPILRTLDLAPKTSPSSSPFASEFDSTNERMTTRFRDFGAAAAPR